MKKLTLLLLLSALIPLAGCAGYRPGSDKPSKLANITKLAVPTFGNRTLVPQIEVMTTNAVIKRLQTQGTYQIVSRGDADAILVGEIADIQNQQYRAVASNTLRSAEILSRLRLVYYVTDKNGTKLFDGQKIGTSHQVLDPNFQLTERQILADCAEQLAKDLSSELTEGW